MCSSDLWLRLLDVIGASELNDDARFSSNADRMANLPELVDVLNGYFRRYTSEIWLEKLDQAGVPAGPILSIGEMLEHPQALARDMVVQTQHDRVGSVKGLGMAVKFHGAEPVASKPPPTHGQHSHQVLKELGYSDGEIEALNTRGVIHSS